MAGAAVVTADFIRANTRLVAPEAVPEIKLWMADEVTPLWQATEVWLQAQNCAPPYWAFAWAGGQATARYILDHPDQVRGARVFDFAAGGGIASIAAAKAGAAQVTANEVDPVALAALRLNMTANDVTFDIANGDKVGDALADCDLILAGDVCYESAMTVRLLPWLRTLAAAGKKVWLVDPGRAYLPAHGLETLATYDIPVPYDLESRTLRVTTVYRLLPADGAGA